MRYLEMLNLLVQSVAGLLEMAERLSKLCDAGIFCVFLNI
jgi:hypothetical protein